MSRARPHILIVDDDNRILKLLKKFLEQNGYLISTATSVKEAEKALSCSIFDLIILDVMLPDITGIDFAKTIKSSANFNKLHKHAKTPIVMLTALSSTEDRVRAIEAGANEYLTKPFEPDELLLRIENLIINNKNYDEKNI